MLYFSLFILVVGLALLAKFKTAKMPSATDAKIGISLLLVSFIVGLIGNCAGGGDDKKMVQQIDALERAKIMVPATQWLQKWGSKGSVAIFLSQNDQGKSTPLQTSCIDELRKQFPATDLKVIELPYQTPVTDKQLDAACGKSSGGVILLCSLPQDPETLKALFWNEDQPKYKTHFLCLNLNSNAVRDFFTSHGENFTALQSKQASVASIPEKASQQELFDQFYETTAGRSAPSAEAKPEE